MPAPLIAGTSQSFRGPASGEQHCARSMSQWRDVSSAPTPAGPAVQMHVYGHLQQAHYDKFFSPGEFWLEISPGVKFSSQDVHLTLDELVEKCVSVPSDYSLSRGGSLRRSHVVHTYITHGRYSTSLDFHAPQFG
jgi:hypothetical protein